MALEVKPRINHDHVPVRIVEEERRRGRKAGQINPAQTKKKKRKRKEGDTGDWREVVCKEGRCSAASA